MSDYISRHPGMTNPKDCESSKKAEEYVAFIARHDVPKAKYADKNAKLKMKVYADKRRNAKRSMLRTGDTVLVQQDKQNKFTTPFDPKPYEIIEKKGSMVTAQREDKQITRDTSNFKSVGAGTQNTNIQDSANTQNTNNQSSTDTDNTNVKSSGETDTPRRSSRNKTPPAYLKDYVC